MGIAKDRLGCAPTRTLLAAPADASYQSQIGQFQEMLLRTLWSQALPTLLYALPACISELAWVVPEQLKTLPVISGELYTREEACKAAMFF